MMKPSIYKVTQIGKGCLYVMPKPSSDWLQDDISYLKQLGITRIVSLLEPNEARELGLSEEQNRCEEMGITFESFPIRDRGLPKPASLKPLLVSLLQKLLSGENLAIHCRGGIGRTGIISCCLLIESGLSAEEALAKVADARGCGIPDTEEQKRFIRGWSHF